MFHKVHHNVSYLNVSTAFRAHFLEIIIINFMKAMLIVILGIQEALVLANEAVMTLFTMLHHTNISFRGEGLLGRVMITPYLHRVHHSIRRNEHDRNYGSVLSLWDRLFGTLAELQPAKIGVRGSVPKGLISLIKCGFTKTESSGSMQPCEWILKQPITKLKSAVSCRRGSATKMSNRLNLCFRNDSNVAEQGLTRVLLLVYFLSLSSTWVNFSSCLYNILACFSACCLSSSSFRHLSLSCWFVILSASISD